MSEHYDVIIVGGRVAGASLAMRLAQQNLNILLIERASFPSWPAVPSSPAVHPGTMRLLDELGMSEEEYTYPDAKATHMTIDMMGKFQAILPMSLMGLDRNYLFGIDRNKFDTVLWERAAALPNVTACQNFAMTDAVKDTNGRVTGIIGSPTNSKSKETITADLVVGADGRFSMAARKFGSQVFEEFDYPSASYHAEWEKVAPYAKECPQPAMLYQLGDGYFLLGIPIDKQKYIIANYMRTADTHFDGQKLEDHYHNTIQSVPRLSAMLKDARRVTPVVGVRRIDNGYRQAYGDGWALVGDAFHYESPIDLQGIYNALLASRILAEAVEQWRNGRPWLEAGKEYQQRFYDSSHDMLQQTVARLRQELYSASPPSFVINPLMRWVLTDPAFQKKYLLYLSRAIDPNTFSFAPSPGPLVRGLLRDIFRVRPPQFEAV